MLSCDYFIYTSAKTEEREGYQIIAKTEGINDEIIKELSDYFYPVGVDPLEFNESRSLRLIGNDNIVYSIIKNIGIGYDMRKGTLYNQSFVIRKKDFQKLNNDSRIFDKYFEIKPTVSGKLEKIEIEFSKIPVDFKSVKKLSRISLNLILKYLFMSKKVAILDVSDITLIQNILAILPPSVRVIPFSTLVNQPERQPEFDFIQVLRNSAYKLDPNWKTVNIIDRDEISEVQIKHDSDYEYLINIIFNENHESLESLHKSFETLPSENSTNKIKFLIHRNKLLSTQSIAEKANEAFLCATIAQNFDQEIALKYLTEAKKYSIESENESLLKKIEVGELALKVQNEPISMKLIENVLEHVKENNSELRSIFLEKIFKKKKNEFEKYGHEFLNEAVSSNSPYKDDILRMYIENKFLHPHLTDFISNLQKKRKETGPLIRTLIKISVHHNFRFLKKITKFIKIDLENGFELNLLKYLIDDVFFNPTIQTRITPPLALSISKAMRKKIEKGLNRKIRRDDHELIWRSDLGFTTIKSDLTHILTSLQDFFEVVLKTKKDLSEPDKTKIKVEISKLKSTIEMIAAIKYEKPTPQATTPNWLDLFWAFWGWK